MLSITENCLIFFTIPYMQLILTEIVIVLENKIIPDVIRMPPKLLTFGGFLGLYNWFLSKYTEGGGPRLIGENS
jgi:hypothetical protein